MSDKIERYKEICVELHDLSTFLQMPREDKMAEIEATMLIRELRQIIERLRRVVGESDTDEPPRSLTDMNKLHKDELAFVAWQFFEWVTNDDCPADTCKNFPCWYRQEQKKTCEENIANGDMNEEEMEDQQKNGYYAEFCEGDQLGCWGNYYLWCYRNGYNPQTGKKNK